MQDVTTSPSPSKTDSGGRRRLATFAIPAAVVAALLLVLLAVQNNAETAMADLAALLPVGYAFGAGMVASVNPCGFFLLPSYISYQLGTDDPDFYEASAAARVGKSLVLAGIATVGFIVVFAIALTIYLTLRKNNVPNLLREFLVPLLAVLRQDVPAREPLHLDLDLTGLSDEKQTEPPSHAKDYSRTSGYPKIRETYYADPWLFGTTQFVDGARVKWEITDRVRKRKITKRNPRGKIKTKHKYKTKRRIDVRLQAPATHYALDGNKGVGSDVTIRVKPGTKRNGINARRTLVSKVEGTYKHPSLAVQPFLDTVAHAYRSVTPTATSS